MNKTVRLIHTNGCAVTVDAAKVDALLARGFTPPAPVAAPPRARRKK